MFFEGQNSHFFRPLTGKYREVVVECLRLLYLRLHSAMADYGFALNRVQLLDVFLEALARAPVLEGGEEDESSGRFKTDRELANWIVNHLLDHGWLECQVDEANLQSNYGFTRLGRLFAQPLIETDAERLRTRNRNTRNTRNALQAFVDHGEIHDLLDAYEYSERIIADFTDVISELDERKRQLVHTVENDILVEKASDAFFDFMEKRFQPDISVRLSADSVEKHRDEILTLLRQVRRKPRKYKADVELQLRRVMPDDILESSQSYLFYLLDGIEARLKNACDIMLPALRRSLQGFTQRADIIIRQMSFLAQRKDNNVVPLCQKLGELSIEQQDDWLEMVGAAMAGVSAGWVDPSQIKLIERQAMGEIQTAVTASFDMDQDARRSFFIQQALEQAFTINDYAVREYLVETLGQTGRVNTRDLDPQTATELLHVAHAIEVGSANQSSEFRFRVSPTGARWNNHFFAAADEFEIELISQGS